MTTEEVIDRLAAHRTLGKAPREELAWLARHGDLRHYGQGEIVSNQREVVDTLHIVLTGRLAIYMNRGTGMRRMMEWPAGEVTGALPYSRMTTPPGDTIVEEPTDSLSISRRDFPDLIQNCHQVTEILVHVMTDRARRFTSRDLRDEKMMSLGKLAAGLAHEVNNPASAALRDAKLLGSTLAAAEDAACALFSSGLSGEQLAQLDALREICRRGTNHQPIPALALADREDAITEWLTAHGITESLGEELARTPATIDDLDRVARVLEGTALESALRWSAGAYSARSLVLDIERAAARIHALVAAAKGFTHMDRAPDLEPVEIIGGLKDTVALLEGRAREKSARITLDLPGDLPPVRGHAVEINQVWMNLIDNAIDAAPEMGHVSVTAMLEGADVIVSVVDDGPGIPGEIRESIFDPFFTTKPVGEGTGLGLDIARRVVNWHNGEITLDSRPGRTEFRVRLPITGAA